MTPAAHGAILLMSDPDLVRALAECSRLRCDKMTLE